MSLTRLLCGATIGLALLACEASSEPVAQGCKTDMECKDNRYCVNGQCQGLGGETEYTCESGTEMYFDLCCPKNGCNGANKNEMIISCKKSENNGVNMSNVYSCLYEVCTFSTFDSCKEYACWEDKHPSCE